MTEQVADDLPLLELMLSDCQAAPGIYQPTNYWQVYQQQFVPELKELGLKDFRSRRGSVLSSFQATDLKTPPLQVDPNRLRFFNSRLFRWIPGHKSALKALSRWIVSVLAYSPFLLEDVRRQLMINNCRAIASEVPNAKRLEEFSMSLVGNPEDVIEWRGNLYSEKFLESYLHMLAAASFFDLSEIKVMVELGAGMGRQAELMHKLFPEMAIFLFDIPPQQYVAQQYLKQVFPGDVVEYRETRAFKELPEPQPGKIYIIPNWQFPLLRDWPFDLFWSTDSFQEMEPDVARNYLDIVAASAESVYLRQSKEGQSIAENVGDHGVMRRTGIADYREALQNLKEVDCRSISNQYGRVEEKSAAGIWRRT